MKTSKSLLTGILVLLIGVVLIICHKMITGQGIIVLAGILFLLTGVINLMLYVHQGNKTDEEKDTKDDKKTAEKSRPRGIALVFGWLVSLAAIILGLCMLVFNGTFTQMIPFIFGLLAFFGAVMLAFIMGISLRKLIKLPGWMWLFPGVMAVLAIIVVAQNTPASDPLIMLLTGISLILFGLDAIILGIVSAHAHRVAERAERSTGVEDVQAKELTEK